ncbi:MAG: hypothetical protein WCG01_05145 [bacterium]
MSKFKSQDDKLSSKQTISDKFQDYVDSEVKSTNIEEGLSEIYQDDEGKIVDMKNVGIEHGRSWLYRAFIILLNLSILTAVAWAGYYYFYQYKSANDPTAVEFNLTGPKEFLAGKTFSYVIDYKNLDRIDLKNIRINALYPENFIFESADPAPATSTNVWEIKELKMRRSGQIKINGRLIGETNEHPVITASMSYMPVNFSSEFQKNASLNTVIAGIGMNFTFDVPESVLLGDSAQLYVNVQPDQENFIKKFRLSIAKLDNLTFGSSTEIMSKGIYEINLDAASTTVSTGKTGTSSPYELKIPFSFKEKVNNKESLSLNFEYSSDGLKYYSFLKKDIQIEVLTKNINLNVLINSSKDNTGVDFGAPLNYTIGYANKGDQAIKNLVIMAVVDSELINWQSLKDNNLGVVSGNKITWSKDQIPGLAELAPGVEGVIDFSINIATSSPISPTKNYQVRSYARFMIGSSTLEAPETENRSNEIVNKINSNLSVSEKVRYFNDDNLAVGFGPNPPKLDQTTSYRVYWDLSNDLNELSNLKLETELPSYMTWDDKSMASLGALTFDATSRKIAWNLPSLSVAAAKANAEFSVSFTPTTTDVNRIAILLNAATLTATDNTTKMVITKSLKPKTSKLEDDDIAQSDGIVQK